MEAAPASAAKGNQVDLPDWVVARLKQDNEDLSRSIVDMVIWVDRVKCWMYQADAYFERILIELQKEQEENDQDYSGTFQAATGLRSGATGTVGETFRKVFGGPKSPDWKIAPLKIARLKIVRLKHA